MDNKNNSLCKGSSVKADIKHYGGCHCSAVRFEVIAPPVLHAYDCKYVINKINTIIV